MTKQTAIEATESKANNALKPEVNLMNPSFKYNASYETDLAVTFKRHGFKAPNRKKQRAMKLALNT